MRDDRDKVRASAILFSANPSLVQFDDAKRHLADHEELYWEVGFKIKREHFEFPIQGYIHVSGQHVEYRVTINDILPFDPKHYEDGRLARQVKPQVWIDEWHANRNECRTAGWKNALVMTSFEDFAYDTLKLKQFDGRPVTHPPQNYVRVLAPQAVKEELFAAAAFQVQRATQRQHKVTLAERNLEDLVVDRLNEIEEGLSLLGRQLITPAGRIDILCKDARGNMVVVELKRSLGTDQVVGQTLRYMGWVHEHYETQSVRGLIIVGMLDEALRYALKAVDNIHAKVFKLSFE